MQEALPTFIQKKYAAPLAAHWAMAITVGLNAHLK